MEKAIQGFLAGAFFACVVGFMSFAIVETCSNQDIKPSPTITPVKLIMEKVIEYPTVSCVEIDEAQEIEMSGIETTIDKAINNDVDRALDEMIEKEINENIEKTFMSMIEMGRTGDYLQYLNQPESHERLRLDLSENDLAFCEYYQEKYAGERIPPEICNYSSFGTAGFVIREFRKWEEKQ